jgi:hypothetical protein
MKTKMTNTASIYWPAAMPGAALLAAPAQVTLKPIEKDPIRIDGGLVGHIPLAHRSGSGR